METIEVVAIGVAIALGIYGAILSTVLAFRERQKEKRRIKAHIEYVFQVDQYQLVIMNIGFRPVTISGASLDTDEGDHWSPIEFAHIFDPSLKELFPVTLTDGEQVSLTLDKFITQEWVEKNRMRFFVYDSARYAYRVDTTHAYKLGYDPGV